MSPTESEANLSPSNSSDGADDRPPDPPAIPAAPVHDSAAGDDVVVQGVGELDPRGATLPGRVKTLLIGRPRDLADQRVFHQVSLIAFLAWVGLGADGLSSCCYGPAEAIHHLGEHRYLAIFLSLA